LLYSGDAATAAQLYHRANESDRRAGRTHGLVRGLVNEATALLSLEQIEAAQRCADEGLELARALHDPVAESTLRAVAGQAALTRNDTGEAVRILRAALTELTPGEIDAHLCELDLADALTIAGDLDAARQAVISVLSASEQRGVVWLLAQPTLAEVTAREGNLASAAELVAAAEREYAERGFRWPTAVRRLDRARAAVALTD
jgi:tetratricopeptide (TPR) repeat protein